MEAIMDTARAFYWSSALFVTLVGFTLTSLYHFPPLLLLLGAAMLLFGAWKVRLLGFKGKKPLGFVLVVLTLVFVPIIVGFFVDLFAGY